MDDMPWRGLSGAYRPHDDAYYATQTTKSRRTIRQYPTTQVGFVDCSTNRCDVLPDSANRVNTFGSFEPATLYVFIDIRKFSAQNHANCK